jgi:hypothetical protein
LFSIENGGTVGVRQVKKPSAKSICKIPSAKIPSAKSHLENPSGKFETRQTHLENWGLARFLVSL